MTRWLRWMLVSSLVVGSFPAVAGAITVVAGARGGWTLTDLVGSNDGLVHSRQAGVLGGILGWEFNPMFSVRVEPGWTQKGADLDDFDLGAFPTAVKLDYFEIPVLAKFKHVMSTESGGGPFGVVGPSFAIGTHSTLTAAGGEENIGDLVEDFDFGLAVGAGWDIGAQKGLVSFEARYILGLMDCFNSNAPRQDVTGDLSNGALQVTVSWWGPVF
jgi:hypothetical protein